MLGTVAQWVGHDTWEPLENLQAPRVKAMVSEYNKAKRQREGAEAAERKRREAEESERAHTVSVSRLQRKGAQLRPLEWYAEQIDELSEELFSESASLYAECGVALLDGLLATMRNGGVY